MIAELDRHSSPDCPAWRALLVDDEDAVRRAYAKVLLRAGCTVELANSGRAAFDAVSATPFDVIVCDVAMQGMSGTDLLRAIRAQGLDTPMILITGEPGQQSAAEAVDLGAFRYFAKPVGAETLGQAVRAAIHLHTATRALALRTPLPLACHRIIEATYRGGDWDFAAVWLPSAGDCIVCTETWTRPGYDARGFTAATRGTTFARGQGLPGRTWANGAPEWLPKLSADVRADEARTAGLRSGFAVPIGADGEVFAVLEFFSRAAQNPDLALLELLSTSGGMIAGQVLRARAEARAAGAEAGRRGIRRMLDAILECAPAVIVAVDEHGKIQFANGTVSGSANNGSANAVIGSDWLHASTPSLREVQHARLQRILATGVGEAYETAEPANDGSTRWYATHMGPLRDADRIVGAVLVSRDVTEFKHAQIQLASAQRLAAIGTLAAGVAHEINTPVQFVSSSLSFLRDVTHDLLGVVDKLQSVRRLAAGSDAHDLQRAITAAAQAEQDADLDYLRDGIPKAFARCVDGLQRVTTIVRSMKEFAHPVHHQMTAIDLNHAIQSTLAIAANEYKYIASLETDFDDLPKVTCFGGEMNQVVLNLVVNAAHAIADVVRGSKRKGTLTVATRRDGDHVVIAVRDTGLGIPAEIAERVFEPFFTTKEVGQGTGQGLALAWTVVTEHHGGSLRFETKRGVGTTFFVRLPIDGMPRREAG